MNRLATLLTLLLASLRLAACGAPAPECFGVPRWPGDPPLHEPPNFRVFSDQPWNALTSRGWSYLRRTSSKDADICVDNSAPGSPVNALRIVFTPDMAPSSEPSVHWFGFPQTKEVYTAWWIKLSANWTSSPPGAGKITFLWAPNGAGQVYTGFYHPCTWPAVCDSVVLGPPYRVGANTEWAPYGQAVWYPNVMTTWIAPGEWHRIEFYYRWETTPGVSGDGIIRWWVDGALNGDYTTVHYPPGGFQQFEFAPTVATPPPAEQYMYVGHTYVSTP